MDTCAASQSVSERTISLPGCTRVASDGSTMITAVTAVAVAPAVVADGLTAEREASFNCSE